MDRFIAGSGSNVPLYTAVRSLVPPAWNVTLSPDVSERFKGKVSWAGNDQWPYVLRKSLNAAGLTPQIDERRKEVVVKFSAQAAKKTAAVAPLQPAKSGAPSAAAAVPAKKIFSSTALTPPAVPVVTEAVKPPVVRKPVILMPVLKTWTIGKGTTLKAGYASWAAKEKCAALHRDWMIRWDTDTDYPIDYPLSFSSATFEEATSQLFNLYRTAQAPLYVSGYRNQCLIVISDKK
ncbi:pilus assembly protein PilL [bacteria symbiont BFo1 of Frankliniella occidentalis]|nr:pilus assembly protein PilL [bacteria symbiont BFo1 of Frankliniella occidentalis]